MHSYRLIYDFGNEAGANGGWWLATAWLAAAVISALLGYRSRHWLPLAGAAVMLIAAYTSALPYWEHKHLAAARQNGQLKVAEGSLCGYWTRVAEKGSAGQESVVWENFTVDGVLFGYYRDHSQPGFRNAQTPPLDLRDGLSLRIVYLEGGSETGPQNRILRLEVAGLSGSENNNASR